MKKLLFLCLILSLYSFSQEKYVSSVDLSDYGQSGYEVKTYERNGDHFIKTSYGNTYYCHIIDENDSFLTLVESSLTPLGFDLAVRPGSLFVTFIDKKNNTMFEYYLNTESDKDQKKISGPSKGSFVRVDR
tara:strand:+ start:976 stop:1368 length:393 start_codon:yes stop_codon:yes gene_type:complete